MTTKPKKRHPKFRQERLREAPNAMFSPVPTMHPAAPIASRRTSLVDAQGTSKLVGERLILDEVIRIGVNRSEDTTLLMTLLEDANAKENKTDKNVNYIEMLKECGFREEWRTCREEELLQVLRAGSTFQKDNISIDEQEGLHKHMRNLFVSLQQAMDTNVTRLTGRPKDATSRILKIAQPGRPYKTLTPEERRTKAMERTMKHRLHATMRLDKLLNRMKDSKPFTFLLEFVQDSRLVFSRAIQEISQLAKQKQELNVEQEQSTMPTIVLDSNRKLLHYYEKLEELKKKGGGTIAPSKKDAQFFSYLKAQREVEEEEKRTIAADALRMKCAAKRIQRRYRAYRQRLERERKLAEAEEAQRNEAAHVLQSTMVGLIRAKIAERKRYRELLEKHNTQKLQRFLRRQVALRVSKKLFEARGTKQLQPPSSPPPSKLPTVSRSSTFKKPTLVSRSSSRRNSDLAITEALSTPSDLREAAAIVIQKWARRMRALFLVRTIVTRVHIRLRREDRLKWQAIRQRQQRINPTRHDMVLWYSTLKAEDRAIQKRGSQEIRVFEEKWNDYSDSVIKECKSRKISDDWVPQMENGTRCYLHIRTGQRTTVHPNTKVAKAMLKKEFSRAESLKNERLEVLETSRLKLEQAESVHRRQCEAKMLQILIERNKASRKVF